MKKPIIACLAAVAGAAWAAPLPADYTVVLTNGRRITVPSYREDGSTLYIRGLGGEIGIPKAQVETVLPAGQTDETGLNMADRAPVVPGNGAAASNMRSAESPQKPARPDGSETQTRDGASDDQKLEEINTKLDAAQARYLAVVQGGGAESGATKHGYRAWTADLMSRLKARRGASDAEYEPLEKEIRDLRTEIEQLRRERDQLLTKIRDKKP
jgi:hypothetical protein